MTAKTSTERMREKRERDKQAEEERLARLLARRLQLDLFKSTDLAMVRGMARAGIEEPQDYITRLIHGADRLAEPAPAVFAELIRLP